jgi:hypothetical protein
MVLISMTSGVFASGSVDNEKPMIPYVSFKDTDISFDGKPNETGFTTFIITTTSSSKINIAWRQNGEYLHVVASSPNQNWIAVGWYNKVPASVTGAGIMNGANIIMGSNETVRDDTGKTGTHNADSKNDIINSKAIVDSNGVSFEFLFPLSSSDDVDEPLTVKSYGYFIFALGESTNVDDGHAGNLDAFYLAGVYIESSDKEGYVAPPSAPFADYIIILFSLGFLVSILKLRKK